MSDSKSKHGSSSTIALCLGALGIVFGDIGTSPLYTLQQCLGEVSKADYTTGVIGILSLMFWALMIAVNFKYLMFVTRADNHGEGGIFALLALSQRDRLRAGQKRRSLAFSTIIILAGAALLF